MVSLNDTQSMPVATKRRLIVLTGPTAAGKGTVEGVLREKHPNIWLSVSATTRKPRYDEFNGIH
ncbi:guanylate kinase, partial [Gardnerella vaginalis]